MSTLTSTYIYGKREWCLTGTYQPVVFISWLLKDIFHRFREVGFCQPVRCESSTSGGRIGSFGGTLTGVAGGGFSPKSYFVGESDGDRKHVPVLASQAAYAKLPPLEDVPLEDIAGKPFQGKKLWEIVQLESSMMCLWGMIAIVSVN